MAGKHIHKLKRFIYSNDEDIYFCVLDCQFKIKVPLALGKTTICWRCGNPFQMNAYSIRLAKPVCSNCKKTKLEVGINAVPIPDYPGRPEVVGAKVPATADDLLSRFQKILDGESKTLEDEEDNLL